MAPGFLNDIPRGGTLPKTSVSVPIVHDNLHADVSVQVGEMQNALTSAEKSKTAATTDWISIPGLKLEIRMFFQML